MGTCYIAEIFEVRITKKKTSLSKDISEELVTGENNGVIEIVNQRVDEDIAYLLASIVKEKRDKNTRVQLMQPSEVKIIGGDTKTLENKINKLLPEWQMDGPLISSGNMFYQKMVRVQ